MEIFGFVEYQLNRRDRHFKEMKLGHGFLGFNDFMKFSLFTNYVKNSWSFLNVLAFIFSRLFFVLIRFNIVLVPFLFSFEFISERFWKHLNPLLRV